MENDGIQRLLKAEDDAAQVIQKAREGLHLALTHSHPPACITHQRHLPPPPPHLRFALPRLCSPPYPSSSRSARAARLRQAQTEADKSAAELRRQLEAEFKAELAQKDAGDSSFSAQLKAETSKDASAIDEGFKSNQKAVIDFLLHHVTTVNLDVSEALRQSLLTKAEQGTQ